MTANRCVERFWRPGLRTLDSSNSHLLAVEEKCSCQIQSNPADCLSTDFSRDFFPSNARWLLPGRLSSRKDNCILQIHRIGSVATSVNVHSKENWIGSIHNPLSCHRVRQKANSENNKTNTQQNTPKNQTKKNNTNRNQKTTRLVISWSVHWHQQCTRKMITLYH